MKVWRKGNLRSHQRKGRALFWQSVLMRTRKSKEMGSQRAARGVPNSRNILPQVAHFLMCVCVCLILTVFTWYWLLRKTWPISHLCVSDSNILKKGMLTLWDYSCQQRLKGQSAKVVMLLSVRSLSIRFFWVFLNGCYFCLVSSGPFFSEIKCSFPSQYTCFYLLSDLTMCWLQISMLNFLLTLQITKNAIPTNNSMQNLG